MVIDPGVPVAPPQRKYYSVQCRYRARVIKPFTVLSIDGASVYPETATASKIDDAVSERQRVQYRG